MIKKKPSERIIEKESEFIACGFGAAQAVCMAIVHELDRQYDERNQECAVEPRMVFRPLDVTEGEQTNGGVRCDMKVGPCACGAWHTDPEATAVERVANPTIVTLCGSTRFYSTFQRLYYEETMAGRIVLSVGFYGHAAQQAHGESVGCSPEQKIALDALHKRKIDMSDEILVLNVGGYIGASTKEEIEHAIKAGKRVRYLLQEQPEYTEPLAKGVKCHACGTVAEPFQVADTVWKRVMGDIGGVYCLTCFHAKALAAGVAPTRWDIVPSEWDGECSPTQQACDERARQEARAEAAEARAKAAEAECRRLNIKLFEKCLRDQK